MKTLPTARTIRNTIISVAAVSAMALPLFASASANIDTSGDVSVFYNNADLVDTTSQEELYERLQAASRKICGSSYAPQRRSHRASCYNLTLTSAVERLDNAEVSALHEQ